MPVETMTLRDAALKLAELHRVGRDKVPAGMLLAKLRAGEIAAGFRFPGRSELWTRIPAQYWSRVSSDKFRSIRNISTNPGSGSFKIRPGRFASLLAGELLGRVDLNDVEELSGFLDGASRQCEIEIEIKELEDYKARNSLHESKETKETKEKNRQGRNENYCWKDLCVIIGASIGQHYYNEKRAKPFKIDETSRAIRGIAEAQEVEDLVDWTSIKPVLSQIRRRIHPRKSRT